MILIPEIEAVLILTPRAASSSLRHAIAAAYPASTMIYRHMEADGVPAGYDRWRRVGLVRHPVDRLWSLYKFLKDLGGPHDPAYIASMRRSVERPFDDWILNNEVVFTSPYDSAGLGRFFPAYTVRHPLPENRKSQFVYLRPDLGTEVLAYGDRDDLRRALGVVLPDERRNATGAPNWPSLSAEAEDHVRRFFHWDLNAVETLRRRPTGAAA